MTIDQEMSRKSTYSNEETNRTRLENSPPTSS